MNTWWERDGKHVYQLMRTLIVGDWCTRASLGELYPHHKGWRVVPWLDNGRGVNLPAMPLKEAKRVAKILLLKAHDG